jgi:aminodeoxychorismate synthase component I
MALAALDRPASLDEWLRLVEEMHGETGFWWLDSALPNARFGRYSFAGTDPYLCLRARGSEILLDVRRAVWSGLEYGVTRLESDPIEIARSLFPRTDSLVYSARTSTPGHGPIRPANATSDAPQWHEAAGLAEGLELPFLGGAVGYFGYELASRLEPSLEFANTDDLGLPDLSLSFVDQILAFDHESERLWIVGLGFGERCESAEADARASSVSRSRAIVDELSNRVDRILAAPPRVQDVASLATKPEVSAPFLSTVDASGYAKAVDTILEEIASGNVYQANFSQRLTVEAETDPWLLYQALRKHNPAPFGAYLSVGKTAILSSSPERFLRLDGSRHVESRPIKGTRPRGCDEAQDVLRSAELKCSEKDRAENLMIVDLVRNDLGRVCAPGSIAVPELMAIEAYAEVFQMVSTVTGTLAIGRDGFDLMRATFPPGSMTGAPKLAAIELLEQLETVRRGVYAGALGYFDLRGGLDLSVVIRTIVWKDGRAYLHVGGGIVADSTPEGEYLESLDKAKAPLAALNAVGRAE